MPVILCMPPHAHTGLHMTSIWEQWNSDLITNSLLLIKTWCLAPSFALFFFASLLLALACLLVVCSPPPPPTTTHTHPPYHLPPSSSSSSPQFQSRTILRFCRCLLPKRAPFRVLQKVISSTLFFSLCTFTLLFLCSLSLRTHLKVTMISFWVVPKAPTAALLIP